MKNAKIIFSVLLAMYMLLAMGGLSLYNHICNCKGELITSILIDISCCQDEHESNACHSDHNHNSCESDECNSCNCETQVEVLKVDNSILADYTVNFVKTFQLIDHKYIFDSITISIFQDIKTLVTDEGKSPPQTGKHIVILHQSLKIPPHIS
jgi:hypothetical protein